MSRNLFMTFILPVLLGCLQSEQSNSTLSHPTGERLMATVADIPLPEGYKRITGADSSFTRWLRKIALKKDARVYLYNGQLKNNQSAQFAVLDIPVGNKDLQQCADAVMRMRAEYLYSYRRYSEISFSDNNGTKYACPQSPSRAGFDKYLERVFAYCGTLSLEKQLHRVADFNAIKPGDVLIKGGSPGHAVMVMDVAINDAGKKIYLLAQSYMPAQDIHLLVNPEDKTLNPWYSTDANTMIYSPEWTFSPQQLRRW
jgi:hypothetical protein